MLLYALFAPGAAVISQVPTMLGMGIDMAQYDAWDLRTGMLFPVLHWGASSRSSEFPTQCLVEDMEDSAGCARAYSIQVETFDTTTAAQDALSRGTELGLDASVPIPEENGGGSVSGGIDAVWSSASSQNRGTAQSGAIGETVARNGCVQISYSCIGQSTALSLSQTLQDSLNTLMDWGHIDESGTNEDIMNRWQTQIMRRFGTHVVIKTNHGAAIKRITSTDVNSADAAQEAAHKVCANLAAENVLQNYLSPQSSVEGAAREIAPEGWVYEEKSAEYTSSLNDVYKEGLKLLEHSGTRNGRRRVDGSQYVAGDYENMPAGFSPYSRVGRTEGEPAPAPAAPAPAAPAPAAPAPADSPGDSPAGADISVNLCSEREQSSTNSFNQEQYDMDCVAVGGSGDGMLAYRMCLENTPIEQIAEFLNGGHQKDTDSVIDLGFIPLNELYQLMAAPPPRSEIEYHSKMLNTWEKAKEYHLCMERNDPEDPVWSWGVGEDGEGTCVCNRYCGNGLEGVGGFLDHNTCSCVCMGDESHGFRGKHCENSYGLCEPGEGTGNPAAANECGALDGQCKSGFNTYNCAEHENCCITSFAGACCPFGYKCGRVNKRGSDGAPTRALENCSWDKCNACMPPDNMVGQFMASQNVPGWMLRKHEEMQIIYPHEPAANGRSVEPQSYTTADYQPAFDLRKGGRLTKDLRSESRDLAGRVEQQFFAQAREDQAKKHREARESREERMAHVLEKLDELLH